MISDTPALAFDPVLFGAAEATASERGQQWRFQGWDVRAASQLPRVAVAPISELDSVPAAKDVLLSRPLLDAAPWVDRLTSRDEVYLTIDHFVHLEVLTKVDWPKPPKVLLEVAVGPGRFGGRPGRDAVDLAKVVARDSRLELAGLTAEVRSAGMADSLLQTRELMLDNSLVCDRVSVSCPPELGAELPSGLEVRHDGGAFRGCIATVIGRPMLELAVIDLGVEAGFAARQDVELQQRAKQIQSTVRVRHVDYGRTLLVLPEDSHDLVIGDQVLLPQVFCQCNALPVASPTQQSHVG